MNIVCDHDFRSMISKLDGYQMDLGRAYTKKDESKNVIESNIKDEFVLLFLRENKRIIYKVGVLGPISVYTYDALAPNTIWVYDEDEKLVEDFDKQLASIDFKKYFANMIYNIKTRNEVE